MVPELRRKEEEIEDKVEKEVGDDLKREEKEADEESSRQKKAKENMQDLQEYEDNQFFNYFDEEKWPDPQYNCKQDYETWRVDWTRMKQHYCCRSLGRGCQDNFESKLVFKNLLGELVTVGFMEERKKAKAAEIIDRDLPIGDPAFLLRPNQQREFVVPYKIPIVFAKDMMGQDIQRHPAPDNGRINIGNITQYETLWSKMSCFLPNWLMMYVPKDVRRYCKTWVPTDPSEGRKADLHKVFAKVESKEDKEAIQDPDAREAEATDDDTAEETQEAKKDPDEDIKKAEEEKERADKVEEVAQKEEKATLSNEDDRDAEDKATDYPGLYKDQ